MVTHVREQRHPSTWSISPFQRGQPRADPASVHRALLGGGARHHRTRLVRHRPSLARLRARADGPRRGVLIVNPGGPGGSGVDTVRGFAADRIYGRTVSSFADHFDVVGFDARGTGASSPVRCGETRDDLGLSETTISYLGYSYGTLLGAVYVTLFPTRVDAMVLDAAVDPEAFGGRNIADEGRRLEGRLDRFLSECGSSPTCGFNNGTPPAERFSALVARLDASPIAPDLRITSCRSAAGTSFDGPLRCLTMLKLAEAGEFLARHRRWQPVSLFLRDPRRRLRCRNGLSASRPVDGDPVPGRLLSRGLRAGHGNQSTTCRRCAQAVEGSCRSDRCMRRLVGRVAYSATGSGKDDHCGARRGFDR